MVLSSALPISLSNVQSEFGGTNPIFMSEYYDGVGFVSGTIGIPAMAVSHLAIFGESRKQHW
jgi:hypothetical protein